MSALPDVTIGAKMPYKYQSAWSTMELFDSVGVKVRVIDETYILTKSFTI